MRSFILLNALKLLNGNNARAEASGSKVGILELLKGLRVKVTLKLFQDIGKL